MTSLKRKTFRHRKWPIVLFCVVFLVITTLTSGGFEIYRIASAMLEGGIIRSKSQENIDSAAIVTSDMSSETQKGNSTDTTPTYPRLHGVVGVLSAEDHVQLRQMQRQTWMQDSRNFYPDRTLYIYFLLDRPSRALLEEQELHGDLIFLNAPDSGWAVRFGRKLYLWYTVAYRLHPDASFVIKMDDDCVVCTNRMWPYVWSHLSPTMYMGWQNHFLEFEELLRQRHQRRQQIFRTSENVTGTPSRFSYPRVTFEFRIDEYFIVLGHELWSRIVRREYCENPLTCNQTSQLYDTNFGGSSLANWLSIYDDVDWYPFNRLTWMVSRNTAPNQTHALQFTCPNYLLVHPVKDPEHVVPIYNQSGISEGS